MVSGLRNSEGVTNAANLGEGMDTYREHQRQSCATAEVA